MNQALQLSEADRLELAEALYESLEGPADPDAERLWGEEIRRRIGEMDAGRTKSIPWSEARKQIVGDKSGEIEAG